MDCGEDDEVVKMKMGERIEGYLILFMLVAEHLLSKILKRKSVIDGIEELSS